MIGVVLRKGWSNRKQAEEIKKKALHDLGERVKELNCLYGLSNLVEKPGISLEKIMQGLVMLIPPAWQYPDITCGRIILDGNEYKTDNFVSTEWKQKAEIKVQNQEAGFVEVSYLKKMPEIDEGPFQKEERNLIVIFYKFQLQLKSQCPDSVNYKALSGHHCRKAVLP